MRVASLSVPQWSVETQVSLMGLAGRIANSCDAYALYPTHWGWSLHSNCGRFRRATGFDNCVRSTKRALRMKVLPLQWIAVLAICLAALAARADADAHALLIGINDYESESVPDLRGAVNDVALLRRVLVDRLGFPAENVRVLLDKDADRRSIMEALADLSARVDTETRCMCTSRVMAHRLKTRTATNLMSWMKRSLPYDARTQGVPDITDDELEATFDTLAAERQLIVIRLVPLWHDYAVGAAGVSCDPAQSRARCAVELPRAFRPSRRTGGSVSGTAIRTGDTRGGPGRRARTCVDDRGACRGRSAGRTGWRYLARFVLVCAGSDFERAGC